MIPDRGDTRLCMFVTVRQQDKKGGVVMDDSKGCFMRWIVVRQIGFYNSLSLGKVSTDIRN